MAQLPHGAGSPWTDVISSLPGAGQSVFGDRDKGDAEEDRANFSLFPQQQQPFLPSQRTQTQGEEIKTKKKHLTGLDSEHVRG